jgi:sec-independent protein translocase protein TatA
MNFILLGMLGPGQIAIIVLVIVLLFGGRKIPELMKGIGQGMTEFKKARKKAEEDDKKDQKEKKDDDKKNDS